MKRLCTILFVLLVVTSLSGFALFRIASDAVLKLPELPPPFSASIPTDEISIKNGQRLATVRGCYACHGQDLRGEVLPWGGRAVAVNLTSYIEEHGLPSFERAVRHGIGADGKSLVFMPSYMYHLMTDEDLLAIAAYLKSLEPQKDDLPKPHLDRKLRWSLIQGDWLPVPAFIEESPAPIHQHEPGSDVAKGEYLALTSCSECHGLDLRGWTDTEWVTPDIAIAAAYPTKDFHRLMNEGVGLGDRELGTMGEVAQKRFSHFTQEEKNQLHAYLRTLADQPVPEDVFWRKVK